MVIVAAAAGLATLLSLYLAPILIRAAHRYGIVDKPKPPLKLHREPVPYLGGLVIAVAFLISLSLTYDFDSRVLALLLCGVLAVAVGLVDDLGTLTPRDKLIGQLIAAAVLVKAGIKVDIEAVPSPADEALSVLWMVTCMNAFNILDVSDGLAAVAGLLGSVGSCVMALLNAEPMIATMSAALAGACLGFLRFNWQPARMYLGDTGSLFLGAMLGAFAMIGRYSEQNTLSAWFVPLCLCALPLFDLVLVIIARLRARKPIYHGSPDHFAVRLKHHGRSSGVVGGLALLSGGLIISAGIGSTFLENGGALAVFGGTFGLLLAAMLVLLWRFPPKSPSA